jgi:hypothetical protein
MNDLRQIDRTTCEALLITCSDFRFKAAERQFIDACGLAGDYDLIARPGAIRSLVLPRNAAARETMVEEIQLLWSLHKFRRILALNHLSCRAYDDIATEVNERETHIDHLRRAGPVLEGSFRGVCAELYLADITPRGIEVVSVT